MLIRIAAILNEHVEYSTLDERQVVEVKWLGIWRERSGAAGCRSPPEPANQ